MDKESSFLSYDAVRRAVCNIDRPACVDEEQFTAVLGNVCEAIAGVPAADAVPIVYGQWIEDTAAHPGAILRNYHCSVCGEVGGKWLAGLPGSATYPYCPFCGAQMKVKNQHNTY